MSYYIIPKIKNWVNVNPKYSYTEFSKPYISASLYYYYNELRQQIQTHLKTIDKDLQNLSYSNYEDVTRIVNPYEYIFSKVPGSKFSVSKLKPKTNLFYDFLEVSNTLNVFDSYKNKPIKTLHITHNNHDSIECFEMLRENYSDEIFCYDEINDSIITQIGENHFDFLFFEANTNSSHDYIISMIQFAMIILRNQSAEGSCIIKIDNLFQKSVVDVLYLLASLYEKVYILKPNSNNITTFDKYIVCKNFQYSESKARYLKLNYYRLLIFLKKLENNYIEGVFDFGIPYYFTIKLEDIIIIIGQQQIDSLDLIINILKNKNREEKIETIKKSNIQKSVTWCEKYKIPFNKFSEKTNIFLPITKEYKKIKHIEEPEYIEESESESESEYVEPEYVESEYVESEYVEPEYVESEYFEKDIYMSKI
jgi:hypothetical protein